MLNITTKNPNSWGENSPNLKTVDSFLSRYYRDSYFFITMWTISSRFWAYWFKTKFFKKLMKISRCGISSNVNNTAFAKFALFNKQKPKCFMLLNFRKLNCFLWISFQRSCIVDFLQYIHKYPQLICISRNSNSGSMCSEF